MRTTGEGGSTKLSGVEKQGRKNGEIEVVEMLICFHVIYSFSIFKWEIIFDGVYKIYYN